MITGDVGLIRDGDSFPFRRSGERGDDRWRHWQVRIAGESQVSTQTMFI